MNKINRLSSTPRPAKWTWLELGGLSLAFFLIVWPLASLVIQTLFPPQVAGFAPGDFTVSKTANTATAAIGNQFQYTITLQASAALDPSTRLNDITDVLPAQVSPVSAFCNSGCNFLQASPVTSGNQVRFNASPLNPIQPGSTVQVIIVVQLNSGATGSTVSNVATATDNNSVPYSSAPAVVTIGSPAPPVTSTPPPGTPVPTNTPVGTVPTPTSTVLPTATPTSTTAPAPTATSTATAVPTATSATTPVPTSTAIGTATAVPTGTAIATTAPAPTATTGTTTAPGPTATTTPTLPPLTLPPTFTPVPTTAAATTSAASQPTQAPASGLPGQITPVILPTRSGPDPNAPTTAAPGGGSNPTNTAGGVAQVVANGVISGVYNVSGSGAPLNGLRVDLVLRGGGSEKVVATGLFDSTGRYTFLSVKPTATNELYFIRFSNPGGGNTLRTWSSSSFTFGGGSTQGPGGDLVDVVLGQPGNAGTTFRLPLTLNWNGRIAGDNYSLIIYRSDGSGVALNTGNLGGATSYSIAADALPVGDYFAEVVVSNANGVGISQRQFRFRIGTGGAPGPAATTAPVPVTSAAPGPGVGGGPGTGGQEQPATAVPTSAVATSTPRSGQAGVPQLTVPTSPRAVVAATPTRNGVGVSNNGNASNGAATTAATGVGGNSVPNPNTLPDGFTSLPASGGEMPVLGLLLAGLTLGWRRVRLVKQAR